MKRLIPFLFLGLALFGLLILLNACTENASSVTPSGSGGSMARFAITGNTLYIVSHQSLEVYDITEGGNPAKAASKELGMGIETIFPYKNKLFIGANDGMYIYNNADAQNPVYLTRYSHVQSCDPVVVQDQYAYVTLRAGVVCRQGGSPSSLDVVDVSNPAEPMLVHSQNMQSPYGLGVSGEKLFVCEGEKGLRLMDITDPKRPVNKRLFEEIPSYDVIVRNNHLIVTGQKGLFQYRFDESDDLQLLSKIPVL